MADKITDADPELDKKPITDSVEGGAETPPKIKSSEEEGETEPEIPVRRSAAQHVIARQKRTIEKLRSKEEDVGDDDSVEDGDEDDSLTPEARGAVQKEVARAVGPLVQSLVSKADEDELRDLLVHEPESAKYEKEIRKYMGHGAYKGVPPEVIYHHLAFDAAANVGVRRKGAANLDAAQARGGGRTSRPAPVDAGDVPSIEEQNEMSDAEFEVVQNRARSGEFVKRGE